ncbi:MAG TPA: hypothetical protein VFL70_10185, partial [Bacteroidia bacterium]|nr:hypothetical protein [Bacteroidia bacterium]
NKGLSIKHDIWNILLILISIVVVEMIFIFLWGPSLFGFVFGKEYELSGQFSQVLVFSFALNFITSAFSTIFISFEKIRLNSIWQIIYFFSICCLYFMRGSSISDFLKTYVAMEIIMHLASICILYYIVSSYEKRLKNTSN